jgi:hypothetical protein
LNTEKFNEGDVMLKRIGFSALLFGFCCLLTAAPNESKTFDLYLTGGYGFGMGGRELATSIKRQNASVLEQKDHYINFGGGVKVEGGAGYRLMEHLGCQVGVAGSFGVPGVTREENISIINKIDYVKEEYSFSTLGIKALLKPTFQVLDLFDVYTDFGVGLFFAFSSVKRSSYDENPPTYDYHATRKDNNYPAVALLGAIGAEYPVHPNVILFGEIYCESMSFMTYQSKITDSNYPSNTGWENQTINYEKNATDRATPPETPGTNVAIRIGARFPLF